MDRGETQPCNGIAGNRTPGTVEEGTAWLVVQALEVDNHLHASILLPTSLSHSTRSRRTCPHVKLQERPSAIHRQSLPPHFPRVHNRVTTHSSPTDPFPTFHRPIHRLFRFDPVRFPFRFRLPFPFDREMTRENPFRKGKPTFCCARDEWRVGIIRVSRT